MAAREVFGMLGAHRSEAATMNMEEDLRRVTSEKETVNHLWHELEINSAVIDRVLHQLDTIAENKRDALKPQISKLISKERRMQQEYHAALERYYTARKNYLDRLFPTGETPTAISDATPPAASTDAQPSRNSLSKHASDIWASSTQHGIQEELFNYEIEPASLPHYGNWSRSEYLGKGQYGHVYKENFRGTEVAVKVLDPDKFLNKEEKFIEDFRKECAMLRRFLHPNIVLFLGAVTSDINQLCIVTEYMPNGTVANLLHHPKKKIELTLRQKVQMMIDIAKGMNWLHTNDPPCLHLDLKTDNLFVDKNLTVKVGDFGLSELKAGKRDLPNTSTGISNKGSPAYMAPEILRSTTDYNEKADVYSFGICMWEIYTGRRPYHDYTGPLLKFANDVTEGLRPEIPQECSEPLRVLMTRCWADNPADRPSFSEILRGNILARALVEESFSRENALAMKLWLHNFFTKERVPWSHFSGVLVNVLGLGLQHFVGSSGYNVFQEPFECIRSLLCEVDKHCEVTLEAWANMCAWFGPLEKGPGFFNKVTEIVRQPYFFGHTTRDEANMLLGAQPKGTFMLRCSAGLPGMFALSVVSRDGVIRHYRVEHVITSNRQSALPVPTESYVLHMKEGGQEYRSLKDLLRAASSDLYLKTACPGSKYALIFAKRRESELAYVGERPASASSHYH